MPRLGRPVVIPKLLVPSFPATKTQVRTIRALRPLPRLPRWPVPGMPVLSASPAAALERKKVSLPLRTGLLAIKKEMTAYYDPVTAERIPCTILQLDRVQVVYHKTYNQHGYTACQVGLGGKASKNVTRPMLGHFAANGVAPKRHLVEFQVRDDSCLPPIGYPLRPDHFQEGQFVDARARCKGKGFQGGMKRWGFHGQDRSHGVSKTHRSMGSAGQSQGGGSRVLPGKKMAGNMGGQYVTMQNLKVLKVDVPNGLLVVNGMQNYFVTC
jgi:large subunit ribosomal protein L3